MTKPLPERQIFHQCANKKCRIVPAATKGQFVLFAEGEMVATHESTRWLSECALGSGAKEVRFDYDLGIDRS